jgi:hypothetical protein
MRIFTTALLAGAVIAALSGEAFAAGSVRHAQVNGRGQAVLVDSHQVSTERPNMRYHGGPKSPMWRD